MIKKSFMDSPERVPGDVSFDHGAECISLAGESGGRRITFASTWIWRRNSSRETTASIGTLYCTICRLFAAKSTRRVPSSRAT
jgi:hypothetical protein